MSSHQQTVTPRKPKTEKTAAHVKIAPKVMGVTVRQCSPGKARCVAIDPWGDRMSNIELETPSFLSQFWPAVLVPVGLGLTVVWGVLSGIWADRAGAACNKNCSLVAAITNFKTVRLLARRPAPQCLPEAKICRYFGHNLSSASSVEPISRPSSDSRSVS